MTTPTTADLERLLPCPFCGADAKLLKGPPGCAFVQCSACKASSDDRGQDRSIAAWNRRADAPVWRDIATAPRDGSWVLTSNPSWHGVMILGYHFEGWRGVATPSVPAIEPTHWLPLPAAPVADSAAPESDHQPGLMPADERQPASAEPVAWQWNAQPKGSDTWHGWREGRAPRMFGNSYEVIERPLYAHPQPMTAQAAAQVLLDQPHDVMVKAFEAMDKRQGEGADRIMFAALRALATEAGQ